MDQKQTKIRPAGVAGSFYPGSANKLKAMLRELFVQADQPAVSGKLIAIVSPHAGYVYSGHVAAHAYQLLKGKNFKRVIVLSPSHIVSFRGASIYNGQAYQTPLGDIPVDTRFAQKLAQKNDLLQLSDMGHTVSGAGRSEHALEVQLPFLQYVLKDFTIVPIIMGDQSYATCRMLGQALAATIDDEQTLIVASSDLSHFHTYEEASNLDHKLLNAIHEWDYYNVQRNCGAHIWEACGAGPVVATMMAAEKLGATSARILKYANSGDIPAGDRSRVVGYAAISFTVDPSINAGVSPDYILDRDEQEHLISIARNSVETAVQEGKVYTCSAGRFAELTRDRGVFVTLRKHNNLRGCIGFTSPMQSLCTAVRDAAISAALRDPRFEPVSGSELSELTYEISVLSPLRRMTDKNMIRIGHHGLLVKRGDREGLLLPQVAVDYQWDVLTFLQHTCQKANLPADAWKDDETDVYMFSAFVFGEQ